MTGSRSRRDLPRARCAPGSAGGRFPPAIDRSRAASRGTPCSSLPSPGPPPPPGAKPLGAALRLGLAPPDLARLGVPALTVLEDQRLADLGHAALQPASAVQSAAKLGDQLAGDVQAALLTALAVGEDERGVLVPSRASCAARANARLGDLAKGAPRHGPLLPQLLEEPGQLNIGLHGSVVYYKYTDIANNPRTTKTEGLRALPE